VDASLQLSLLGRASLAALLGFAIGLERELRGKSAGDRTFALLAFAAAAVTGIGAEVLGPDGASRVIQGVVTGVGFLVPASSSGGSRATSAGSRRPRARGRRRRSAWSSA